MKKLFLLAGILLAFSIPSYAVSVSSSMASVGSSPELVIHPNESLTWTLTGTATGTIKVQLSESRQSWRDVSGTETVGAGPVDESGTIYGGSTARYFRFYVSTITAGTFTATLTDNDDFVDEKLNLKGETVYRVFDEAVAINRAQGLRWEPNFIVVGGTVPVAAGTLAFDSDWDLYVSSGNANANQWIKVGGQ